MTFSFDLSDKVVVVTGGSRGLGLEMSRAFAAQGATVVVASRKGDACHSVADEVRASTGRDHQGLARHVGQ